MITKEIAVSLSYGTTLYHRIARNKDGSAARCRVNGACKTWKTRPGDWSLPVKYGLRDCFHMTQSDASDWMTEDPTERERFEKDKVKSKGKLCKRFGMSDDVPDCIVRDRMLDENIKEDQWPLWLLKV